MENEIKAIQIFNLIIKTNDGELASAVEPTENFAMLFPEKDMMGTVITASIRNFMQTLIRFIKTRIEIVVNTDGAKELFSDMPEIAMSLCLDSDNNCFLDISPLREAFEFFKEGYDEKDQSALEIFWEFLILEINDFEEELSHDINGFWKMKEKGFDVQVLKVE